MTGKQRDYADDLLERYGLSGDEFIYLAARAGEDKHPNNAGAKVRVAYCEGRRTLDDLTARDARSLIRVLRHPWSYGVEIGE